MTGSKTKEKIETKPQASLYILAGEASGDLIGASLIRQMRALADLEIAGVGGVNMFEQGLKTQFPITDLSVMGYVDVILRLPLLLLRVRQVINKIMAIGPDIVVLIDSQVFSNLVAKGLKKKGFRNPILLYVCPTVWGYKPERAQHIKAFYDEVLAILPFEPAVMKSLNGPPCQFVGHPALQQAISSVQPTEKNTIVLMPGSRTGELRRHLPMLRSVVEQLHADNPQFEYVLFTLPHLVQNLKSKLADWSVKVYVEDQRAMRADIFAKSKLGIVVAGTVTMELAVSNVPMVVSYVMDPGQLRIKKSINVKHFALPNLVLDEALVPELLFEKPEPEQVRKIVQQMLDDPQKLENQLDGFARMREKMEQGTQDFPRVNPAQIVLSYLPSIETSIKNRH